jgi:hypothetical protein
MNLTPPCNGLSIQYTNHPDTGESGDIGNGDSGMLFDTYDPNDEETGACSAGVVNSLMDNLGSYADTATGIQALLSCAARLSDDHDLPDAGGSVDIASALTELEMTDYSITTASIERLADEGGLPVYVTKASGWIKDVPRDLKKNIDLYIKHVQTKDDNAAYKGIVQYKIDEFEGSNDLAISIAYEWEDKSLAYRFRQKQTPSGANSVFDESTLEIETPTSVGSSWQEIVSAIDHNGFGKVAFVWATFDLLVFNVETKTDGTGRAYFGHNPETVSPGSEDFFKIKGFRCYAKDPPPQGSSGNIYSDFVQHQSFKLNSESGTWDLKDSNIKYAPTVNCNWNSASNATFQIQLDPSGTSDLTYPITHDLYSKADYEAAWTPPSGPTSF